MSEPKVVWECRWWRVEERLTGESGADHKWYSVHRPDPNTVSILGLTDAREVPVLRQWREPLQANVWELPAGISDVPGEAMADTAAREMEEETGWRARRMLPLLSGTTSSGLTDELFNGFLGLELEKVADGGGLDGEQIEVHLVPFAELGEFMISRATAGEVIDIKVMAHLMLAERKLREMDLL
ncbi:MAG: NUDIX hydrolase [bacterium]|nr:NUDIX hydrolase [bacterium]